MYTRNACQFECAIVVKLFTCRRRNIGTFEL